MREIHRDIVSAVIISSDKKILLGRKDPSGGGVYTDCWQIPGGGIEDDESKLQALQREVLEEVGLDIKKQNITLLSDHDRASAPKRLTSGEEVLCHMKFFVYLVRLSSLSTQVTLTPGDDFIECKWVGQQEINQQKLTPAGVRLFEEYSGSIFRGAGNTTE